MEQVVTFNPVNLIQSENTERPTERKLPAFTCVLGNKRRQSVLQT